MARKVTLKPGELGRVGKEVREVGRTCSHRTLGAMAFDCE